MNLIENDICPLLEFDDNDSIRKPNKLNNKLPRIAIMCFFEEIINSYINHFDNVITHSVFHESIKWNFYIIDYKGAQLVLCQAPIGAPLCVNIMEDLYSNGVEFIIACGSCGVLEKIDEGEILIPTSAIRDEGTSYHYVKASKEIQLNKKCIDKVEKILNKLNIKYQLCKTWTTDASRRETPNKITLRKKQGCKTVEMECSALAACAEFNHKYFVELLYSGDLLFDINNYNDRNWQFNNNSREKIFSLCLEIVKGINENYDFYIKADKN